MRHQDDPAFQQQQDDRLKHRAESSERHSHTNSKAASDKRITIARQQDQEREAASTPKSLQTWTFLRKVPPAVASATCAHAAATRSRGTIDRCKVTCSITINIKIAREAAPSKAKFKRREGSHRSARKQTSVGLTSRDSHPAPKHRLREGKSARKRTSLGYMDCCPRSNLAPDPTDTASRTSRRASSSTVREGC